MAAEKNMLLVSHPRYRGTFNKQTYNTLLMGVYTLDDMIRLDNDVKMRLKWYGVNKIHAANLCHSVADPRYKL